MSAADPRSDQSPVRRRERLRTDRRELLRRMIEIRLFEDQVLELFGRGVVKGTTHTSQGQEAVSVGIAAATQPDDAVLGTYRGHALALALGLSTRSVLGELAGRVVGAIGGRGGSMHLSDPSVGLWPTFAIVGAGIPVAAGVALAAQLQKTDRVAVCVFGDGASNIGAFHEGLNLASVWRLPVVYVCENNLYGEYSRIDHTTATEDIFTRAAAYHMPGRPVDGQDVDEVRAALSEAVERARLGGGPTLLEAKTYRYRGHSRSDSAPYRPVGELEQWTARDPIELFTRRLQAENLVDEQDVQAMWGAERAALTGVVEDVLATPEPPLSSMFDCVLAEPPEVVDD